MTRVHDSRSPLGRVRGDAGSVTTEMVIITPIAIALVCLIALVGRTATAREQVNESARDAARAASLERDSVSAKTAAESSAANSLQNGGLRCATSQVDVDVSDFRSGGQVAVTIQCDISLTDLGLIGISGTHTASATAVSVVDAYKGVS
jgi:Flp pilus assembly protein TadG